MSSEFIIVSREKENKDAKAQDSSPTGLAEKWFSSVKNISPEIAARIRDLVQHKLETGACQHFVSKMPPEYRPDVELKCCVEDALTEQWNSLTSEERLLIRFPIIQAVGDSFEVPNRGVGIVISRELTPRFGVEMVFQLKDGSFFKWEFID